MRVVKKLVLLYKSWFSFIEKLFFTHEPLHQNFLHGLGVGRAPADLPTRGLDDRRTHAPDTARTGSPACVDRTMQSWICSRIDCRTTIIHA